MSTPRRDRPTSTLGRRAFLSHLPALPVLATAAGGLSGCAGVPYVTPRPTPDGMVVPLSAFGEGTELLLEQPGHPTPIYVRRTPGADPEFTAVRLRCTHRGCQPDPEADRLVCPCHGSEFGFDGRVLQGPAEAPLDRFEVRVAQGALMVSNEPAAMSSPS